MTGTDTAYEVLDLIASMDKQAHVAAIFRPAGRVFSVVNIQFRVDHHEAFAVFSRGVRNQNVFAGRYTGFERFVVFPSALEAVKFLALKAESAVRAFLAVVLSS